MKRYIQYKLTTLEPMKLAGQGSQQGTIMTRNFIQGSAVRGALIGEFCRKNPKLAIDESIQLREEFLTDTKFFHAYIARNMKMAIPVPFVFTAAKDELKKPDNIVMVNSFAQGKQEDGMDSAEEPVKRNGFCTLDDQHMWTTEVRKTEYLHIQKAEEKEKESYMFRYEAIAAGQVFIGYIQCEEDYVEDFKNLMEKKVFYVGGSRGSGYGKCKIEFAREMEYGEYKKELPVQQKEPFYQEKKAFIIYALSDLVLYNQYGMVTNHLEESYLERLLEIQKVALDKMACDTSLTSGYNNKQKAHGVQQTAVRAGSVFRYEYEGSLSAEKIRNLEEKGVGLRKEEGFGQILINPDFGQTLCRNINVQENEPLAKQPVEKRYDEIFNHASKDDKEFIQKVQEQIIRKKKYEIIVYKLDQKKYTDMKEKNDWKITRTQGNTLKKMLDQMYELCLAENYEAAKKFLKDYLIGQQNFTSLEATMLSHIKGEKQPVSILDFLQKMSAGQGNLALIHDEWNPDLGKTIFGIHGNAEANHFSDCCLYLKELLRYFLREEA